MGKRPFDPGIGYAVGGPPEQDRWDGERQVRVLLVRPHHWTKPTLTLTVDVDLEGVKVASAEEERRVVEAAREALGLGPEWVLEDWEVVGR